MAKFEIEHYFSLAGDELRAARVVLAMSIGPLLFFMSTLGYLGGLNTLAKLMATLSAISFVIATALWGVATMLTQLSIISVKYEQTKGLEGGELRAFAEEAWNKQNEVTSKLFPTTLAALGLGLVGLTSFVILAIWMN
jgi:small-conductance mechanosensitive channel